MKQALIVAVFWGLFAWLIYQVQCFMLARERCSEPKQQFRIISSGSPWFHLERVKYGIYRLYIARENRFDEDEGCASSSSAEVRENSIKKVIVWEKITLHIVLHTYDNLSHCEQQRTFTKLNSIIGWSIP